MKAQEETRQKINRKTQLYKISEFLWKAGVFAGLLLIIFLQWNFNLEANDRSDDQRDKIIRRLDCVVVFLSKTNRDNLSINDVNKCSLNRDKDVQQFFSDPEPTPAEQPPNLPPSSGGTPSGAGATATGNPGSTPDPADPGDPDTPPPAVDPPNTLQERGLVTCVLQLLPNGADPCKLPRVL